MTASFTQEGGSHISYEDKLTTKVIPLMLMAFTAAAAVIGNLFVKRRREGGGMHPTLQFMLAALGMHWVFLLVHTMHLRSFAGGFGLARLTRASRWGVHGNGTFFNGTASDVSGSSHP